MQTKILHRINENAFTDEALIAIRNWFYGA
jgi:hypothetical protein